MKKAWVPAGKQDDNFKRARRSAGQQVPAPPHSAWPRQGQALQSHRSAPSRPPGFCAEGIWLSARLSVGLRGRGRLVVAGREEAGDKNVLPSQHSLCF